MSEHPNFIFGYSNFHTVQALLLSKSLCGLPSVISNESSISEKITKLDTLNRELNKIYRFL